MANKSQANPFIFYVGMFCDINSTNPVLILVTKKHRQIMFSGLKNANWSAKVSFLQMFQRFIQYMNPPPPPPPPPKKKVMHLYLFPPFVSLLLFAWLSAYTLWQPILQTIWTWIRLLPLEQSDQGSLCLLPWSKTFSLEVHLICL